MKVVIALAVLVGFAGLAFGLMGLRDVRRERALRTQDSLDAASRAAEALLAHRKVWQEEQAKAKQRHDAELAEYRGIVRSLRETNRVAAHELAKRLAADSSIPESTFADISKVVAGLSREAETCSNALAVADSACAVRDKLLLAADSTITEQANLLHGYRAHNADLLRLASPSFWERMRSNAPWLAVTAAGFFILGAVTQ